MKKLKNSKLILLLKLSLGIGIIIFFLLWFNVNEIIETLSKINLITIVILFGIYIFDRLFMAYKWGLLIKSFEKNINFWLLAKAYFYGSFTSQIMPISISGDVVRFYSLSENVLSKTYLFSSMVIEKIFGFFSMVVAVILAVILYSSPLSNNENFYFGIFILIVLIIAVLIILFLIFKTKVISNLFQRYNGKFKEKIINIISSFNFFSQKKEILIKFFLFSLVEQIFPITALYILSRSLEINISYLQTLFVASIGILLARLPISPSAIGIQEGAFVGLFILIGIRGELGFALSITSRILDIIYPLPFILVYLSETMQLLKKSKNKESQLI